MADQLMIQESQSVIHQAIVVMFQRHPPTSRVTVTI